MLKAYEGNIPPPPPRYSSATVIGTTNEPSFGQKTASKQNTFLFVWRESIGIIFITMLSTSILFSALTIFYYAQRQKSVYEEIVDYLDKTVTVSKINFNPILRFYEIPSNDLDTLSELRKYKTHIWTFFFSDLACYAFFIIALFIYFVSNLSKMFMRFLFWFFLGTGAFYSIAEVSVFSILIFPQSQKLPNATESLLDRAVPHNTGGLMQMESRLGCIFNQNLYNLFKRRQNQGNTCDPFIVGSFITTTLLILFVFCRVISLFIFALLATLRNPIGDVMAMLVFKMRPTPRYKTRYTKNPKKNLKYKPDLMHAPKTTTFGINEPRSPNLPTMSTPPLGQLDHSISYNNAAFFAISDMLTNGPMNSSRSSEISKCDMPDVLFNKGSTHTTNSLVSEV